MQAYVLIITTLWMSGPEVARFATTTLQEFTSLKTCLAVGDEIRNTTVQQAREAGVYYLPRVKAVCLPK
jgi:hypothetical protein